MLHYFKKQMKTKIYTVKYNNVFQFKTMIDFEMYIPFLHSIKNVQIN